MARRTSVQASIVIHQVQLRPRRVKRPLRSLFQFIKKAFQFKRKVDTTAGDRGNIEVNDVEYRSDITEGSLFESIVDNSSTV